MLAPLVENIWLSLTVILPGLFTYGLWRLLLLFEPSSRLDINALIQIDSSVVVSSSVIIAIALLQQIVALLIEFILACLMPAYSSKNERAQRRNLFWGRANLYGSGKQHDVVTRIVGNFYLSLNISVGLLFLLIYFVNYDGLNIHHWLPTSILKTLAVSIIVIGYRMKCAIEALALSPDNKKETSSVCTTVDSQTHIAQTNEKISETNGK